MSDVESLRTQLRERGYLTHGIERWFALDPWSSRAFWLELITLALKAATLIAAFGALPLARIGNTLGLDELTVASTDTDAGALMAGKYLSPRVFIRYSYGLFNRIGGLLLRFNVNDRLSIETRSGDQTSMDLFYTIEKE